MKVKDFGLKMILKVRNRNMLIVKYILWMAIENKLNDNKIILIAQHPSKPSKLNSQIIYI